MNKGRAENLILASLLSLVGFCSLALTVPFTSADGNPSDSLTVNIPSRCSIITTNSTAHTAQISKGIYSENIGETVAKTICNDAEGFSIYAVGYTGDTYGSTVLASDISSSNDIPTGTATSGNTSNWAMKLTAVAGDYAPTIGSDTNGSFANYHVVPSEYVKVASFNANTDDTTGGTIKTTYSAFISLNQASGNYDGKVKYTLVHPASETIQHDVTVTLDAHVSSVSFTSSGYPVQTVINGNVGTSSATETITLRRGVEYTITATFASDYEFSSWSTTSNGTLGSTSANPTTYTVTGTTTLTITSQAEQPASQSSCPSSPMISTVASGITYFQDINSGNRTSVLSSLNTGSTYQIKDNRDNKTYCVGKLADGNLWMLDNLRLDLVANKNNLNASNTNASNTTLNYLKNGGGSSPYTATAVAYASSSNTSNTPQVAVSGTCNDAYCVNDPTSGQWTSSSVTQETINGATSIAQGKIGAYYNYCAASAGSYCYDSSSGTGNATEDICPKGWRLPTGGSSGEFNNLYSQYSGGSPSQVAAFQIALATPLSSYFYSGTARYQGLRGDFWSSTYGDSGLMYSLYVDSSYVDPSSYGSRVSGFSIRCVLSASELYP